MFDKMKQMMDFQRKAQEMKRELENTVFEISSSDGLVKLTMTGAQEIREVNINADLQTTDKFALERAFKDAYSRSLKRSHEIAAQKMKEITGFSLPGM